jgi:hypothetical protein
VSEDELRQICVQFGELIYVKIPVGKGCGFVQYASRYVLKWKKVYSIVWTVCYLPLLKNTVSEHQLKRQYNVCMAQW